MLACWKINKNKTICYFSNVPFFGDDNDIDIVFEMLVYSLVASLIL